MEQEHIENQPERTRAALMVLIASTIGLLLASVGFDFYSLASEPLRDDVVRIGLHGGAVVFVALCWSIFYRAMVLTDKQLVESQGKLRETDHQLTRAHNLLELRAEELAHANADLAESNLHLSTEIETRIHAEAAQRDLRAKLLSASRQAGIVEIAGQVLQSVGEALEGVKIAALRSTDLAKHSRAADLAGAIDALAEHLEDLPGFLAARERGDNKWQQLRDLAGILRSEHRNQLENLQDLCKKVDDTMQFVKAQQTYTRPSELEMELDLAAIVDDVLNTLGNNFVESGIELVRELRCVPPVRSDKPKVMQILANLVTNAVHALLSTNYSVKRLTVRLDHEGDDRVYVEVEDTGIGIDAVHLSKIFQYGFTTKQTGHGFGLHHSALVARELGGDLRVHSDGIGRGARFTLELPVSCAAEVREAELVGV